jgi:hypothetical protein
MRYRAKVAFCQIMNFRSPALFVVWTLFSSGLAHGSMYDEEPLESGLLYRVRMDRKLPCPYLQVTMGETPIDWDAHRIGIIKVLLLAGDRKTVLQRMEGKTLEVRGLKPEQGDFNFDGYRDFRCMVWHGSGGRGFIHFLFDPKKQRYVRCPALDELWSPYPDYERKILRSNSRGGGMYSRYREYRWVDGRLVVISEVWRDHDDEKGYFTEYSTFKNGKKVRSVRSYLKDRLQ